MRILSMFLAVLMLMSIVACTKNPNPAETTDPASTTAPAETEDPALKDNLPDEKFDNEEIIIWLGHNLYNNQFNPDPDKEGDVMGEATNKRNAMVEDRFGVVLKWLSGGEGVRGIDRGRTLQTDVLAGDRIDIANGSYINDKVMSGCFLNLADNEILDLEKPWHHQYVNENLRINDRKYLNCSWFDFNSIGRSSIVFFNMDMAENYDVGDLYQMVYDGTWTYDKMMEIGEMVAEDVNNDGLYDDNDRYGMAGRQDHWFQQVYTTGYTFITTNDSDELVVSGMDDRLINAFDTVRKIFASNWYQSYYTYGETARPGTELYEGFNSDRFLFLMTILNTTSSQTLRDGGKFGLLPTPKFTKDQEYGAATLPANSAIPVTTGNERTTSIIWEAMAAEAYKVMRPAYFDIALSYKYVNDATSREMLDIALSNLYCDFGYMFMDCGIGRQIPMTLTMASGNLASWMATYTPSANAGLKSLVDQIMALPD